MKLPSIEKKILEAKKSLKLLTFEQQKYDKKNYNNYYTTKKHGKNKRIDYMELKMSEIEELPNEETLLSSILEFEKECAKSKVGNFYSYYFISNVKYLPREKAQQTIRRQIQLLSKSKAAYNKITELINGRERFLNILKKQLQQYNDIWLFRHIKSLEKKNYDDRKENQLVQSIYSKIHGLRLINIQLIEEIKKWKKSLQDFRRQAPYSLRVKDEPIIFIYQDQNYLLKMLNDINFMFDSKFDEIKFAVDNDPFIIKPLKMSENYDKIDLEVAEQLKLKIVECLEVLALEKGEDIKLKLQNSTLQQNGKQTLDQSSIIDQRKNRITNVYKPDKLNSSRHHSSGLKNRVALDSEDEFDKLIRKYEEQNIRKVESKLNVATMKRYSTQQVFQRGKSTGDSRILKKNLQIKKQFDQVDDIRKESDEFKRRAIQSMQFKLSSRPILKITSDMNKQVRQIEAKKLEQERKIKLKSMFEKYKSIDATAKQQKTKVVAITKLKKQNNLIKQLKEKLLLKQQSQKSLKRKSGTIDKQAQKNITRKGEEQKSLTKQSFNKESRKNEKQEQKNEEGLKNLKQKIKEITGTNNKDIKNKMNSNNQQFFVTQLSKVQNNRSMTQRKSFVHVEQIKVTETNKQLRKRIEKQLNQKYKMLKSENESISSINTTYIQNEGKQLEDIQGRKNQLQKQIKQQENTNKNKQEQTRKAKIDKLTKVYKSLDKVSNDQRKKINELNNLKEQYKKIKNLKKQYYEKKNPIKLQGYPSNNQGMTVKKNQQIDEGLKNIKERIKQITGKKLGQKIEDSRLYDKDSQSPLKDKRKIRDSEISKIYFKKQKLLVKDDIYNSLKKGRTNDQSKQFENNQLRKKIEEDLKQKYKKLNSQNYSRMSEEMTFNNSEILEKQTKTLMEAQRKRLQLQKAILQQQFKQQNEKAFKKIQEEANKREQKIRRQYQIEIKKLYQTFKKQNFDIKYKLEVQEMKRKQKQEQLKLQLQRKQKLQAEINRMGLNDMLLVDQEKSIQVEFEQKLLENENIKQQIQEYRQKIQQQAKQQLIKIQIQNKYTLEQLTKKNQEEEMLKAAIQKSRKHLQKRFLAGQGLSKFQQMKKFYDQIQPAKKQKVENYYKQIVESDIDFSEQMKLKLKLEIIQELELQEQREIIDEKIYEEQKQFKLDMMKYQYLKIVEQEGIVLEQSEKQFLKLHEERLRDVVKKSDKQEKQDLENKQSILRSVQQRKKNLLKNVESDDEQQKKIDTYKPEIIKQADENQQKQATTIVIQTDSPKKQQQEKIPEKKVEINKKEIIKQDQEKIDQLQSNTLNVQNSPDKEKNKSTSEPQEQILKKWENIKPFLKSSQRIYISINDVQQYIKNFIAKQDIEFANMIPYSEKQLVAIFRKKQVDIFQEAFGWKQNDRYLLIGKVSCLGQIEKLYGNIQVEIRMKMDGKNIHEKRYFAKKIKFFESIGYLFQKKLNDQQKYAIKILIKIPKGISNTIKNTNKVHLTFHVQMYHRKIQKSNNENSFIFPLAKKLSTYLTQQQKIQLNKYAENDFISNQLNKLIMHFNKSQQTSEKINIEQQLPGMKTQQIHKQLKMSLRFEFPICLSTYPCYRFSAQQFYNVGLITYYKYVQSPYIFLVIPLDTPKLQFNLDTYLKLMKKATDTKEITVWMPIWKSKRRNVIDNYGIKSFIYKSETLPSFDLGSIVQQPKGNCSIIKPPFIFAVLSQHIEKYEQMTPIFAEIVKSEDLLEGKDLV